MEAEVMFWRFLLGELGGDGECFPTFFGLGSGLIFGAWHLNGNIEERELVAWNMNEGQRRSIVFLQGEKYRPKHHQEWFLKSEPEVILRKAVVPPRKKISQFFWIIPVFQYSSREEAESPTLRNTKYGCLIFGEPFEILSKIQYRRVGGLRLSHLYTS